MTEGRGRIVSIIGTRPEAIKMAPVVRALADRGLTQQVLLTGQHAGLAEQLDVPAPVHDLAIDPRERSIDELRELIRGAVCGHLVPGPPELVLVQGDTVTALAGALAARDCGAPLGHVEAGLRSFDLRQPFPEEANRVAIDQLSHLLFAPTAAAAANLAAEPEVSGRIFVTGNTGIDALFHARAALGALAAPEPCKAILVTCHRRENQGRGMLRICAALRRIADELPVDILLPLHPNRHVRSAVEAALADHPKISLIEPVEHQEMVRLMLLSWLIVTDSGGLQEEGPALGRPVLVLRNLTERGEAADNIELVGTSRERIFGAVARLLDDPERYARMATPSFPFGDGHAAPRIAAAIEAFLLARAAPFRDEHRDGAGLDSRELA